MYAPSYTTTIRKYDDINDENNNQENQETIDENCVELVGQVAFDITKENGFYALTLSLIRYIFPSSQLEIICFFKL